jgi:Putative prokaryotic signal transducing protein
MEAEMIRSLLRTEGIESAKRKTDFAVGVSDGSASSFGPFEILVSAESVDSARELIGPE